MISQHNNLQVRGVAMDGNEHPSNEGDDKECPVHSDAEILFAETVVETTGSYTQSGEELPQGCHTVFTPNPDGEGSDLTTMDLEAELAAINAGIAELDTEPQLE